MTNGRSKEFKVKINGMAIQEIIQNSKQLRITDQKFLRAADYDTVHAAYLLLSLKEFLEQRRCEPDFEVVLNE